MVLAWAGLPRPRCQHIVSPGPGASSPLSHLKPISSQTEQPENRFSRALPYAFPVIISSAARLVLRGGDDTCVPVSWLI